MTKNEANGKFISGITWNLVLDWSFLTFLVLLFQTEEKRTISHLQFTTWPDQNTSKLPEQLVKFICYMRRAHSTGPIVAHCSTGIGRSGVLLVVEVLLSYIEKDLSVSIKQIIIKYYKLVWMSATQWEYLRPV